MVHLIFDSNIWIYFAEGQHPFILNGIIEKLSKKEIVLLVNEEIKKEWDRNKIESKARIEKELQKQINNAKELSSTLCELDSIEYKKLIGKISNQTPEYKRTIEERYKTVDGLIKNESTFVPIKQEHKLKVIDLALKQKAPFHRKKNSVADALILLSAIDYLKENGINDMNYNGIDVSDSVFISYNSEDFSKGLKGIDKDIIHPDLKPYLDSVGMTYERNFGKILNLTSDLTKIIEDYRNYEESRIIEYLEWENEIRRGK